MYAFQREKLMAQKLASEMSGKWQKSLKGGTRGGKRRAKRTRGGAEKRGDWSEEKREITL